MMKIFLLFFMLTTLSMPVCAQHTAPGKLLDFPVNKPRKIFATHGKIHDAADFNAKVLDSLPANREVQIISKEETVSQNDDLVANWFEVTYLRNKKKLRGFIWGGDLAVASLNREKRTVLLGFGDASENYDEIYGHTVRQNFAGVKVFENTGLVREVYFKTLNPQNLMLADLEIQGSRNLRNVDFIIEAAFTGAQSRILSYTQHILFTKNKELILLPQLRNMADADHYSHKEEFYFPKGSGGTSNQIHLVVEEREKNRDANTENATSSVIHLLWDGRQIQLQ